MRYAVRHCSQPGVVERLILDSIIDCRSVVQMLQDLSGEIMADLAILS